MAEAAETAPKAIQGPAGGLIRGFLQATEVDVRLIGMLIALAVIWIGFNFASNGLFLSPRNLWNLSVQTATIAILANGMVLIIVSRNIDLSVGSFLGFVGMIMAVTQAEILPPILGHDFPGTLGDGDRRGPDLGRGDRRPARVHHRVPAGAGVHRHARRAV